MLRSRFSPLLPASALAAGLAAAVLGCSVTPPGEASPADQTTVHHTGGDAGTDAAIVASEAGDGAMPTPNLGNPLCLGSNTDAGFYGQGCTPDSPVPVSMCLQAPDGGTYDPDGGYADASLACRVEPSTSVSSNGLGIAPLCAVAGDGKDGALCKLGTDCAAGFDCVGSLGTGVCRRYCCAGNGSCPLHDQFCDIQALAKASATKIPVCMPIVPCALLADAASCPMNTTCGVVRETGETSCVETGNAQAGDSCETEHCKAGLVCLGTAGARQCFTLCSTSKAVCTAPATCQGGLPLFQDPSVGVCR